MNSYLIQQKIKTLASLEGNTGQTGVKFDDLRTQMTLDGIIFKHWTFTVSDGWGGDAWTGEKVIEAKNVLTALGLMNDYLSKVVPKICFISQCSMDYLFQSYLALKLNVNSERNFFYRYTFEDQGVGLHFGIPEIESYKKLKKYQYQAAFRYLHECNNVATYYARLALLFPALEAMAGKIEIENADGRILTTYDKNLMKKILGGDLYNKVFGEKGLRHRFYHGDFDFRIDQDYTGEIYSSIVNYFNKTLGAKIPQDIVHPQRHFSNNYYSSNYWLKPKSSSIKISLPLLLDDFKNHNKEFSKFTHIAQIMDY